VTILISPTEPEQVRVLGNVSSTPEKYGADYLWFSPPLGMVGVQRKEINDFVRSVYDGRLGKEAPLLQTLEVPVLMVEGKIEYIGEHLSLKTGSSRFTRAQFLGTLWSLQSSGLWVVYTNSLTETIESLSLLRRWSMKQKHGSLRTRAAKDIVDSYGLRSSRAWQIHILQGFPGFGAERAERTIQHFGKLPLALTEDLTEVEGVGPKLQQRVVDLLDTRRALLPAHGDQGRLPPETRQQVRPGDIGYDSAERGDRAVNGLL
jgi:DNA excision repair protein ERCC-4